MEDHAEGFAREKRVADTVLKLILELIGQVEDAQDVVFREIQQFEQMVHGELLSIR